MSHYRTGLDGHTIYRVADDGVNTLVAVAMEPEDAARIVRGANAPLADPSVAVRLEQAWNAERTKRLLAEEKFELLRKAIKSSALGDHLISKGPFLAGGAIPFFSAQINDLRNELIELRAARGAIDELTE